MQDASGKRPIWSMKLNRAECAIWAHEQEGLETRYSIMFSKEYFSQKEQKLKRGHYFDAADLRDVRVLLGMAEDRLQQAS